MAVGGSTPISTQIVDQFGAPISGIQVVFTITSEPGTDAALGSKTVTRTTDNNGYATANLQVGTTPGVIVVTAQAGLFTTSTIIQVTDGPVPSGSGVSGSGPWVPGGPVSPISPPSTGSAGFLAETSTSGANSWQLPTALAVGGALILAGLVRRRVA